MADSLASGAKEQSRDGQRHLSRRSADLGSAAGAQAGSVTLLHSNRRPGFARLFRRLFLERPLAPKPWSGRGRPPSLVRRDLNHRPVSAKALAASLAENAWTVVTWREGTNA